MLARDPRISGEFISAAVAAGLASSGIDVLDAGVIPTPAAAYLVGAVEADFGVMVSASHNPAPDNGIKFFAIGGTKLPDEVEDRIEEAMAEPKLTPTGGEVGRIRRFSDAEDRYILHLLGSLDVSLEGLHVVIDAAHGAAAAVSPQAFTDAGAKVTVIGNEPDGMNINDGVGSTHLGPLRAAVLEHGADLGIAHDGDADRCLAIDAARRGRRRRPHDGDPRDLVARSRDAEERHARRDRHEQPRPARRDGGAGHHDDRDPRRRPLRARGAQRAAA